MTEEEKKGYKPINMTLDIPVNTEISGFAKQLLTAINEKYDAFFATQLTLIAKEKGVSVADLCLCHENIQTVFKHNDNKIMFWVEVK